MTCKPPTSADRRARAVEALRPIQDAITQGDPFTAMEHLSTGRLARCLGQWVETRMDELPAELRAKGWPK